MWRVVEELVNPSGTCVHHRGVISTVKTDKYRWGRVTVSDSRCGDGRVILRRRKHHKQWHIRQTGSDWESPDSCAEELRRIPRRVLEDLLYKGICKNAR